MSTEMSHLSVIDTKGKSSDFSFKKLTMLVCTVVFLFVLLFAFSSGNSNAVQAKTGGLTENTGVSILSTHDTDSDGDGLSDDLETNILYTDVTDKYGDKDQDGLYDFEEYLDHYGTPDNTGDTPKYNYNDNSTHGDILDIYHKFGLNSNRAGYLRDTVFTVQNGGFTNYLLWNVTFNGDYAGGSFEGSVSYIDNTLSDVTFSGYVAGGSYSGSVSYIHNTLTNVAFSGTHTGGSSGSGVVSYEHNTLTNVTFSGRHNAGGSGYGSVSYLNNTLTNVAFSGMRAGGSYSGSVSYTDNTLIDVTFSESYAGGSFEGSVSYTDNTLIDVTFSEWYAGGSRYGSVSYIDNTLSDVTFSGYGTGGSRNGSVSYIDNTLTSVTFSEWYAGGSYSGSVSYISNTLTSVTFSGKHAGGSENNTALYENNSFINVRYLKLSKRGDSGISASGHTNYTNNSFDQVQFAQLEGRRAEYHVTSIGNTIITDSYDGDSDGLGDIFEFLNGMEPEHSDSDGDGLNDAWEVKYDGSSGVNPISAASVSELRSDADGDGLSLSEEEEANTDPEEGDIDGDGLTDGYEVELGLNTSNSDTDGDGLTDGWEVMYNASSGVNPLSTASVSELRSDADKDGLSLSEEGDANTDPDDSDTDGDGLNDAWEVMYSGSSGVDPLSTASVPELSRDADKDGLSLSEEEESGTDPDDSDTDDDGLNDRWEVMYSGSSGVDPLSTASDLSSDVDMDGLSLSEEEELGTDPDASDTDGDGLNDGWEVMYDRSFGVDPLSTASVPELSWDADKDGLSLSEEEESGTNPDASDTDGDGLNDGWEVMYSGSSGVDPLSTASVPDLSSDVDMDGLSLSEEEELGTDPDASDTDGDGLNDGWEVMYDRSFGVDPLSTASVPELNWDADMDGLSLSEEGDANTDPDASDTDDDGLNDGWEVMYSGSFGVDPLSTASFPELNWDADKDGLSLSEEEESGTNPDASDTDGDGLNDGWEVKYSGSFGVDPMSAASTLDLNSDGDMDGLSLSEEEELGTDSDSSDTDGDGLNDGWEVMYNGSFGVDPLSTASVLQLSWDADIDGLNLSEEEESETNPDASDTDGDGLNDGWEVMYSGSFGVDPVERANLVELYSDQDNDTLTLLEEEEANTDPEFANANMTNGTWTGTGFDEVTDESPFTFVVFIAVFMLLGVAAFAVRIKRKRA